MAEANEGDATNLEPPRADTEYRESFPGWERFERPTYIEAETRPQTELPALQREWWAPGSDASPKPDFAEAVAAESTLEIAPEPNKMELSSTVEPETSSARTTTDMSGETATSPVLEPGAENIDSNPDAAVNAGMTAVSSEAMNTAFNEIPTEIAATEALSDTEDDTPSEPHATEINLNSQTSVQQNHSSNDDDSMSGNNPG
jgi:hypothetical protein